MLFLLLLPLLRSCKVGIIYWGQSQCRVILTLLLVGFDKLDRVGEESVKHTSLLEGCSKLVGAIGEELFGKLLSLFFRGRVGEGRCLFVMMVAIC